MCCGPVISQIHSVLAGMDAPIQRFFGGFVSLCGVGANSYVYVFPQFLFWLLIPHLIWVCAGAGWWWIDDRLVRSFGSRGGKCIVQGHPRMSTPARKRLMRDFKRLMQDPPAGISGAPQDNNILLWNAVIFGYDAELSLSPLLIWTAV